MQKICPEMREDSLKSISENNDSIEVMFQRLLKLNPVNFIEISLNDQSEAIQFIKSLHLGPETAIEARGWIFYYDGGMAG